VVLLIAFLIMSITIYPRNKGAGFDKDLFEIKKMVSICCRLDLVYGRRLIFSSFMALEVMSIKCLTMG
jgi:hypothetical protein